MAPVNQNPDNPLGGGGFNGPASPPPAGTVPNFEDPSNRNYLVRAVLVTVIVLTSIAISLRIYSRVVLRRIDLPTVLGLVAFSIYAAFISLFFKLENTYGWFVHMWDLRLKDFPAVNQIFFQGLLLYCASSLVLKPAILLDWMSIFVPDKTRNFFFWSSCAVLTIHVLFYIAVIIVELAACTPFEKNWNLIIPGKCLDTIGLAVGISAVNLALDVVIFLLPQKVIWGLRMHLRTKIGVSIIFAIGLLACISAIFRLVFSLRFYQSPDVTYTFSGVALWCLGELTSGILILCGPGIPKAMGNVKLQKLGSSLRSWAGASARKLASSGSSFSAASRKRSKSSLAPSNDVQPTDSGSIESKNRQTQNEGRGGPQAEDVSIVRTTQFTLAEGQQSEAIDQEKHTRQHPWIPT